MRTGHPAPCPLAQEDAQLPRASLELGSSRADLIQPTRSLHCSSSCRTGLGALNSLRQSQKEKKTHPGTGVSQAAQPEPAFTAAPAERRCVGRRKEIPPEDTAAAASSPHPPSSCRCHREPLSPQPGHNRGLHPCAPAHGRSRAQCSPLGRLKSAHGDGDAAGTRPSRHPRAPAAPQRPGGGHSPTAPRCSARPCSPVRPYKAL